MYRLQPTPGEDDENCPYFFSKIHDRIQHCFLSFLLWFSCSSSRKRLRFRMWVCEKRQPRERGLGLVWLILPHNKFHCTCYHFTRAGNAIKFEPLRCRREKKNRTYNPSLMASGDAAQDWRRMIATRVDVLDRVTGLRVELKGFSSHV